MCPAIRSSGWVRNEDAPFFIDNTHLSSGYSWGQLDSALGALFLHNIVPMVGLELGPVEYTDAASPYTVTAHNRYDTPAAYAAYCGAMEAHVSSIFGDNYISIPGNELNDLAGQTDGPGLLNGAPPPPVVVMATGGSLAVNVQTNYEVAANIGGTLTLASQPYYQPVTPAPGTQEAVVTWGPSAAETAGYSIYRLTGGTYGLVGTVAHGVTTFTDTGSTTPGAAPPSTSTVMQTGLEADLAAYWKPCYTAIKAANPNAIVYGGELNMVNGETVTPATFIQHLKNNYSCGVGTCYDALSIHLYPTYPFTTSAGTCLSNDGTGDYGTSCLSEMETAVGTNIPIGVTETAATVNGSSGGSAPSEFDASLLTAQIFQQYSSFSYTRFINYANLDECGLYGTGNFFSDGCLVTTNNLKQQRWAYAKAEIADAPTPLPTTWAALPTAVPTVAPTATPVPTPGPTASALPTSEPNLQTAVVALHPRVYYRMNESSGTVATDSSGNSLNGTYSAGSGNLTYTTPGLTVNDANVLDFNVSGSTGLLDLNNLSPSDPALTGDAFTLNIWAKSGYGFYYNQILGNANVTGGNGGIQIATDGANHIVASVQTTNGVYTLTSTTTVATNALANIVFVYTGSQLLLYINNGTPVTEAATGIVEESGRGVVGSTENLEIGNNPGNSAPVSGTYLSEFFLLPVAISPTNIGILYNLGL
jgi:hypothetical protein